MLDRTGTKPWPPNYAECFLIRQKQIMKIRSDAKVLPSAKEYYRTRPAEFIDHWCDTYDPRNAGTDLPTKMPFILFRRQEELVEFTLACIDADADGLVEKCRDLGATWVECGVSVWLWLFWDGVSVGWGSRKEQLVDKIGDPDSIFEKMRMIIRGLPIDFLPVGFDLTEHMTYMRIVNPETQSTITGEAGDNIGRGGRKRVYFKDESAHYEHPEAIEASLADNTRCQIDISSVNGLNNVFHRKRESGVEWVPGAKAIKGRTNVFVMDWSDHPGKSQEWYDQRRKKATDEGLLHIFMQEVERNYSASVAGVIIKAEWVTAAIDAHIKLGFDDSGMWCGGLDVADDGPVADTNALALRKGIVLRHCDEWGGVDTGVTARRAINQVRMLGPIELQYDCIGLGSGVKAEANRLATENAMPKTVTLVPWNAGAAVLDPDGRVVIKPNGVGDKESPLNIDFYTNLKAQAWWQLARRFERTWRALNDPKFSWVPDQLISIDSTIPLLRKIQKELSQATMGQGARLKLVVNKTPEGTKSPNTADSIVMCYWPLPSLKPMAISDDVLAWAGSR